ncbi:aspartyl-phosphate phosphatase Spo0E family protein [Metabacillus sediminilitoris]|uniref:Aspartyl-phosphate phosphatase Spo0E family protein n=2 Tax=Metabacillus sediminilitoris TaxID=2567941 RepID=A0A4S4BVY3_9BACI|nr:Spo0E family sporulation regulatory protein-aspartic acid phosphatase [Metabacillus sediminilitoris]THF79333.1 aspartyl-phosphate phosphatase Spo0E family protein [Metabacillus sediminilitoris]
MSKQEMLHLIEQKRAELIDIVLKNGLNSTISIKYSQELDQLLIEYIKNDHAKKNNITECY